VHNAWLATIEDGIHTYDVYEEGVSTQKVGTKEFADAVIERIGRVPETLPAVEYRVGEPISVKASERPAATKTQLGVDVFLHWRDGSADQLAELLLPHATDGLRLDMISNRGQKVWPGGSPETLTTDHWRCRFLAPEGSTTTAREIVDLQSRLVDAGLEPIKTEGLFAFDGVAAFSKGQGQ
jgi:isocitrate dehydrogenase